MSKQSNLNLALDLLEVYITAKARARFIVDNAKAQGRDVTDEEIQSIKDETRIIEDRLLNKFRSD